MGENGESRRSFKDDVLGLLEDQLELASLEWKYEKTQSARRLGALGAAAVLMITAFALLQVAILYGLQALGLATGWAALIMLLVYAVVAAVLVRKFGHRDTKAGSPFQASREELKKNVQWIRQNFS